MIKKYFLISETIIYENNLDQQIRINYQNELSKFLKERKIVDPKLLSFPSEMKNGNHSERPNERKVFTILLLINQSNKLLGRR